MAETKEYKKIKKIYGETFAKLCRELFPTILEEEGKLSEILEKKFANNGRTLGEDVINNERQRELKKIILNEFYKEKEEEKISQNASTKTPYEILDEEGYNLYECKTEDDIEKFRSFYRDDELLCTFNSKKNRLERCFCFFAVKKDVEEIRREDFEEPEKDDEYSTSVLGIQFDKTFGTTEIISRYNHTVINANCTLDNDLDKLAPGLEQSFKNLMKDRGIVLNFLNNPSFACEGYTLANDGRYYKYNMEIEGDYYCPGNVAILGNRTPQKVGKLEEGIIADYFYINQKEKSIELINPELQDSFIDDFKNKDGSSNIKGIDIVTNKEEIEKIITQNEADVSKIIKIFKQDVKNPVIIGIDKNNNIVAYKNDGLEQVKHNFLRYNQGLTHLDTPNLRKAGDCFLCDNNKMTQLNLPKLKQTGFGFLYKNDSLVNAELPKLEQVGDCFLINNNTLEQLNLPKLKNTGDDFLLSNGIMKQIELPELEEVGNGFMGFNTELKQLRLPKLKKVGKEFLFSNDNPILLQWKKWPKITSKVIAIADGVKNLTTSQIRDSEDILDEITDEKENEQ